MRLWQWQQSAWAPWTPDKILFHPEPYVRTGPGNALDGGLQFDLKKFNPVYFDRMKARIAECRDRGIYCAVQLFQGFSSNKPHMCGEQTWAGHPYNCENNINGLNGGHGGTASWARKSFVRGRNTLLMDAWDPIAGAPCPDVNWGPRPGSPLRDLNHRDDPTWEPIRRALGFTRQYANRMDLASVTPQNEFSSTSYCLANPEREFLVYLPEGDSAMVDLSRMKGTASVEWMHPVEGVVINGGDVPGGAKLNFAVPFPGAAVLYIRKGQA